MPEKKTKTAAVVVKDLRAAAARREETARAYLRRGEQYRAQAREMRQVADELAASVERGTAGAGEKP